MATGMMVDGAWTLTPYQADPEGRFLRNPTRFHGSVGTAEHPVEAGRYHLYVSLACPWAHRTLIVRALRGLESALPVSVVSPLMIEDGWTFEDFPGVVPDPVLGARYLRELYAAAEPRYTGRVTVPILWDKARGEIVNNESREIIRQLGRAFAPLATRGRDLCPPALQPEIDAMITANYDTVNNGVYRAGFASSQRAYDEAVDQLFARLAALDTHLAGREWLVGDQMTEADVCLFPTLVRFDPVYFVHFKCSRAHIRELPNLWAFTRRMYADEAVRGTVSFPHIVNHYYRSHPHLNPKGIVAAGPDFDALLRA